MFVSSGPPAADTLEVSLFGTGIGEALALHVGSGEWILVDSCRQKSKSLEPLNLSYLRSLGVDPAKVVKQIVATHWHDDHVNGLGELVEQCKSASLVFSQALATDEFRCIVGSFSEHQLSFDNEKSGVKEMARCLNELHKRKSSTPECYFPPVRTLADHRIFRRDDCEVFSLSPSPDAVHEASREIASLWQALKTEAIAGYGPRPARAGVPCPERNHNAVALWVKWGDRRVLLGADLEEHGDRLLGWQAVLACSQFPDGQARVFKIPHHGSPNGDHAPIWTNIVASSPFAILTAYNRGHTPRPSPADIERIKRRTNDIYYTSLPRKTANSYERTVERTIKGVVRRRNGLGPTPGHIQMRWDAAGNVSVEIAGAANKI
jgi:beta-lactamase superfamily II metal-dependent hydrolase